MIRIKRRSKNQQKVRELYPRHFTAKASCQRYVENEKFIPKDYIACRMGGLLILFYAACCGCVFATCKAVQNNITFAKNNFK